ncbi:hypothetical protein NXT3_PB00301 (plasmid) [Sinorhizobium fredii]|uniref:Uncharacterized protein n=1 Tax=Rhizobium fredii TaxID=380 RepID=A0A2L0HC27_RHIFR|nr:hypothetical protein NXT3_PB00301 [Sinorhizobium fredii]
MIYALAWPACRIWRAGLGSVAIFEQPVASGRAVLLFGPHHCNRDNLDEIPALFAVNSIQWRGSPEVMATPLREGMRTFVSKKI